MVKYMPSFIPEGVSEFGKLQATVFQEMDKIFYGAAFTVRIPFIIRQCPGKVQR